MSYDVILQDKNFQLFQLVFPGSTFQLFPDISCRTEFLEGMTMGKKLLPLS